MAGLAAAAAVARGGPVPDAPAGRESCDLMLPGQEEEEAGLEGGGDEEDGVAAPLFAVDEEEPGPETGGSPGVSGDTGAADDDYSGYYKADDGYWYPEET